MDRHITTPTTAPTPAPAPAPAQELELHQVNSTSPVYAAVLLIKFACNSESILHELTDAIDWLVPL